MKPAHGIFGLLLVVMSMDILACWGQAPKTTLLDEKYTHAKYVVLAVAEQVTQKKMLRYKDPYDLIENVRFRVIHNFKGDKGATFTLQSHSDLEFGCSVSAFNHPSWLDQRPVVRIPLSSDVPNIPVKISGVWLIFADQEPFILDDQLSRPIELVSGADWIQLFQLESLTKHRIAASFYD